MQNLYIYKNRPLVTLIILLLISLSLMFFNVRFPGFNIRSVFFFLTYPVQYSVSSVGKFFVDSAVGITRIRELENELNQKKVTLLRYQEALSLYSQITKENDELRNALVIKGRVNHTTHYARVVFRDPNLTGDYFIVDKGSFDGLKVNMPVISYNDKGQIFLVGKTVEVNMSASKVKLLTAVETYVGVTLKDSGYIGILKGVGSWKQNCIVEYIPIEASAYVGEEVQTSGESDIFPAGILIGKIVGVGMTTGEEFFKKLYVKPEFKYTQIKDVFIIDWKSTMNIGNLIENTSERNNE